MSENKPMPKNGQELYQAINQIYSCPHGDSKEEIVECVRFLDHFMTKEGLDPALVIKKANHLNKITEGYKSKLSTQILSRFWTKELVQYIPFRPYKMEE